GPEIGAQPRVLCEVPPAARVGDDLVEPVEQLRQRRAGDGEVERERPPADREADKRAAVVLEALQHCEERRATMRAQAFEHGAHHRLRAVRYDELVLPETARAVDAIPAAHRVERVEETGDAL